MPDLQKINQDKEKIFSTIEKIGPSYPSRIARDISMNPLFVSAFLSELVSENKLKISHMKVGSSPLYYIKDQKEQLENFIEHLNFKEKEAFQLIKNSKILEDEKQDPAIRVALRNIKDFSTPLTVKIKDETKIFWKLSTIPNEEAEKLIIEKIEKTTKEPPIKKEINPTIPEKQEEIGTQVFEKPLEKPKQVKKTEPSEFTKKIKEYLMQKDFEILNEILSKKKEFISKIRLDIPLGKQEFYLISKDKKRINENDLTIAIQKAQSEKMPALIISTGELDKKAQEYLKEWRNLIKFEKINF